MLSHNTKIHQNYVKALRYGNYPQAPYSDIIISTIIPVSFREFDKESEYALIASSLELNNAISYIVLHAWKAYKRSLWNILSVSLAFARYLSAKAFFTA